MYSAHITRIKNLRKHKNADRLMCGECFGNTVVVGTEIQANQLGIYFPSGSRVGLEYAETNNLLRKKDEFGNSTGGYLDPRKRNIKALNMRKEKSDGLFMPLESLKNFTDVTTLKEGDTIDVLKGITICEKYIPQRNNAYNLYNENRVKRGRKLAPVFSEHVETEQLVYFLREFKPGDLVEITIKLHGTSQRTGYLPVLKYYETPEEEKGIPEESSDPHESSSDDGPVPKDFRKFDVPVGPKDTARKPVYDYDYISGTRHTICGGQEVQEGDKTYIKLLTYGGRYEYRQEQADKFIGKLYKGETVYYEVVGFDNEGNPIMPSAENKLLQDKAFTRTYGKETVFSYGCDPKGETTDQNHLYVYRMTLGNEDGEIVEYQPWQIRERCAQIGVDVVPQCKIFIIPDDCKDPGQYVLEKAEKYFDGPDPIGKTHVREGVVCRILNRTRFVAYKHKNYAFKVLSGLALESVDTSNMSDDILSEL